MTNATVIIDPPPLYCGTHTAHQAIVAIDICGCIGGMSVIEHREPEAYRFAASEAKSGFRIETWTVARVRTAPLRCPDHQEDGPPWWEYNHVKGTRHVQRPETWPPQGLGL